MSDEYKAELIINAFVASPPRALHLKINGGCDLARKCKGVGDCVAEAILMQLPNSATIKASWVPGERKDGFIFTKSFAGYGEQGGDFIRFDNAHDRNKLHVDMSFRGQHLKHDEKIPLTGIKLINRRRIALQMLMWMLERDVDRQIPIWFYMPWSLWWPDFSDFGEWLFRRLPEGLTVTEMCEAVLAYLSFNVSQSEQYLIGTGVMKHTVDTIKDAIDRITSSFLKNGEYGFSQLIRGHVVILPFPMYAPPGSEVSGLPTETLEALTDNRGRMNNTP